MKERSNANLKLVFAIVAFINFAFLLYGQIRNGAGLVSIHFFVADGMAFSENNQLNHNLGR